MAASISYVHVLIVADRFCLPFMCILRIFIPLSLNPYHFFVTIDIRYNVITATAIVLFSCLLYNTLIEQRVIPFLKLDVK